MCSGLETDVHKRHISSNSDGNYHCKERDPESRDNCDERGRERRERGQRVVFQNTHFKSSNKDGLCRLPHRNWLTFPLEVGDFFVYTKSFLRRPFNYFFAKTSKRVATTRELRKTLPVVYHYPFSLRNSGRCGPILRGKIMNGPYTNSNSYPWR